MLKCLVIDDEPLAIQLLEEHIRKVPFLELALSSQNALEALPALHDMPIDLVLLDIQMPLLTGLQFMQMLHDPVQVIITSAYQEYAIDGFEHNVVDYLLKPISFERFYRAVSKAYKLRYPARTAPEHVWHPGYIFVKVETRMVRVELDDICYITGLGNYVSIYTRTQRIVTLQTMKQLEDILPYNRFVRVHKSYIVALDKIVSIEKQEIQVGDRSIPIGHSYAEAFLKKISA
jgi:DNA-binding LytR/AlgR family response regulator